VAVAVTEGTTGRGCLVLELDAACSGNSLDTPVEADESQELTYVDIDTFLASF